MKTFIAIIISIAIGAVGGCYYGKRVGAKEFFHPSPKLSLDTISLKKASDWIYNYRYPPAGVQMRDSDNAYVNLSDAYDILLNVPRVQATGVFFQRGFDVAKSRVVWLAWEAMPPSATAADSALMNAFVLPQNSCVCLPCCTKPQ